MYKAIVFAGTTEGYALCEFLAENHVPVYACAATEYGGSLLKENEFLHVSAGRLKTEDMEELFRREAPEIVLDATHPYAAEVTKNIRTACENGSIRYQRVLRPEGEKNREAIYVESTEKAAELLSGTEGNIFLTTGSKELSKFTVIPDYQERLFARVLSIPSVISPVQSLESRESISSVCRGHFPQRSTKPCFDSFSAAIWSPRIPVWQVDSRKRWRPVSAAASHL